MALKKPLMPCRGGLWKTHQQPVQEKHDTETDPMLILYLFARNDINTKNRLDPL